MVIKNLRNTKIVSMALHDLGWRHEEMGVEREHYPMIGAALLETFAGFFGEKWTPRMSRRRGRPRLLCAFIHPARAHRPSRPRNQGRKLWAARTKLTAACGWEPKWR